MTKMDYYWRTNPDWYYFDDEGRRRIKPDAPKEAKESFKRYCEQMKRYKEYIKKGINL